MLLDWYEGEKRVREFPSWSMSIGTVLILSAVTGPWPTVVGWRGRGRGRDINVVVWLYGCMVPIPTYRCADYIRRRRWLELDGTGLVKKKEHSTTYLLTDYCSHRKATYPAASAWLPAHRNTRNPRTGRRTSTHVCHVSEAKSGIEQHQKQSRG